MWAPTYRWLFLKREDKLLNGRDFSNHWQFELLGQITHVKNAFSCFLLLQTKVNAAAALSCWMELAELRCCEPGLCLQHPRCLGGMNPWSSQAGKCGEAAGLVLRAREAAAMANYPLCWEQPASPAGTLWCGWLAAHVHVGSWEGMVIVSSRLLCPFRRSQAGDGKYSALVSPCPCCVPAQSSEQRRSTPQAAEHAMGCTTGYCRGPGLGPRGPSALSEAASAGVRLT